MVWLVFAGWGGNRWPESRMAFFHALSPFHRSSCFCFSLQVALPVKNCYFMLTWKSRNPKSGMNFNERFFAMISSSKNHNNLTVPTTSAYLRADNANPSGHCRQINAASTREKFVSLTYSATICLSPSSTDLSKTDRLEGIQKRKSIRFAEPVSI